MHRFKGGGKVKTPREIKKKFINVFDITIVLITSIYPFRFYFNDSMLGEPFDTKAQLAFHEHWFDFFKGTRSFLDAGFFYPYPTSFALSDIFVISGPVHALFRVIGFDLLDSLKLSTLVIVILSNLGWLVLANKIIKSTILKYLFVLAIGMSYTYVGHVYEKPNMAAYGLVSWFIVNIISISAYRNQSSLKTTNLLGLLISIPIILALNVWYPAYFIILFLITTLGIFFIILFTLGNYHQISVNLLVFFSKINRANLTFWIVIWVLLSTTFLLIYLPEFKNDYSSVNQGIFLSYSPTLSSFFDTSGAGGGLLTPIYNSIFRPSEISPEMNLGINPFLFFTALILIGIQFRFMYKDRTITNIFRFSTISASTLIVVSIIKFTESISGFYLFWEIFSPLRTMRIPIRLNVIFNFVILIFLFYFFDKILKHTRNAAKLLIYFGIIVLIIDMLRVPNVYWEKSDLIDDNLLTYSEQLSECKSFVIDREDVSWWKDSIDGLVLSTITKIPTVNGFSSIYPRGYPSIDWLESSDLSGITNWLKIQNGISNSCLITHGQDVIYLENNDFFWSAQQGFTRTEYSGEYSWNWMVLPKGHIIVYNLASTNKNVKISFALKVPACNIGKSVSIEANFKKDNYSYLTKFGAKSTQIEMTGEIEQNDFLSINFNTDTEACVVASDPRDLYMSVNDFKLRQE